MPSDRPKTTKQELLELMRRPYPGDEKQRTYLQLVIEGQAKAAIKGNTDAAKNLIRLMRIAEEEERRSRKRAS